MDDDSDGDAYEDIDMDRSGKPVIPVPKKRPPIPKGPGEFYLRIS